MPGADQAVGNVTKAASTNSTNVELRIHDGAGVTIAEALLALEALKAFITTDAAPA